MNNGRAIAIVTASTVPHPDLNETSLIETLTSLGFDAKSVAWDDPGVNWSDFAVAVIRSTWNYELQRERFVAWAYSASEETTVLNPPSVIEWNTDKSYLLTLANLGVPVIQSSFTAPGELWQLPSETDEFVIKPSVGGGARGCGRFSAASVDMAKTLVDTIHASGRTVITQPHMRNIDISGERVLIFIDGTFSHCVLRGPILDRDGKFTDTTIGWKTVRRFTPSEQAIQIAEHALVALGAQALPYARVDIISDDDDNLCILEIELTEPCLFLEHDKDSVNRLAQAIAKHV